MCPAMYLHRHHHFHRLSFNLQRHQRVLHCLRPAPGSIMETPCSRANDLTMTAMVEEVAVIIGTPEETGSSSKCEEVVEEAAGRTDSADEAAEETITHHQSPTMGLPPPFQAFPTCRCHHPQADPSTIQWPQSWLCRQWACHSPACPPFHYPHRLLQLLNMAKAHRARQPRTKSILAAETTTQEAIVPAAPAALSYTKTAS